MNRVVFNSITCANFSYTFIATLTVLLFYALFLDLYLFVSDLRFHRRNVRIGMRATTLTPLGLASEVGSIDSPTWRIVLIRCFQLFNWTKHQKRRSKNKINEPVEVGRQPICRSGASLWPRISLKMNEMKPFRQTYAKRAVRLCPLSVRAGGMRASIVHLLALVNSWTKFPSSLTLFSRRPHPRTTSFFWIRVSFQWQPVFAPDDFQTV